MATIFSVTTQRARSRATAPFRLSHDLDALIASAKSERDGRIFEDRRFCPVFQNNRIRLQASAATQERAAPQNRKRGIANGPLDNGLFQTHPAKEYRLKRLQGAVCAGSQHRLRR